MTLPVARMLATGLSIVSAVWLLLFPQGHGVPTLAVISTICFAGALAATWNRARGLYSALTLYIIVLYLFHCGLLIAFALGGVGVLVGQGDNSWLLRATLGYAVDAVLWGVVGLQMGCLIALHKLIPRSSFALLRPTAVRITGYVSLAVGFPTFFTTLVQGGGLSLLSGGYGSVLEAAQGSSYFGYGAFLIGLGCACLIADRRTRKAGWSLMLLFAAVCLPLGLRGTVLFPLMALLYVEGRRTRPSTPVLMTLFIAGLTLVSAIRQTRQLGVVALFGGDWNVSPLKAVAEMGYSLYPVVAVQDWMTRGTPPTYGLSYIIVPLRTIERLLGFPVPPGAQDPRLFNVEMMQRVGPAGGSPIAEAFRGGGLLYVVVFMVLVGALLKFADSLPTGIGANAVGAVILIPLFFEVRNSFAPVPVQWCLGMALLWIVNSYARRH